MSLTDEAIDNVKKAEELDIIYRNKDNKPSVIVNTSEYYGIEMERECSEERKVNSNDISSDFV